jgi:two-component system nitrate/nitrite sensor histidine kinase NarX
MQKSSFRLFLLRLSVVAGVLLSLALYRALVSMSLAQNIRGLRPTLEALSLAAFGIAAYLVTERILSLKDENKNLYQQLIQAEKQFNQIRQHQNSILRISQQLASASKEEEAVEIALSLARELLGARGASFVPLDERAQPLSATTLGEMPFPTSEAWLEYLASPGIRQRCAACQNHEALIHACPLLEETFRSATGVYCLPLRRGEQEFGIFNLYLPATTSLDFETQSLLRALMDETAAVLETLRLRQNAIATLRHLQAARQGTDLQAIFTQLLQALRETFEADYALIALWDERNEGKKAPVIYGEFPPEAVKLIQGIAQSISSSRSALTLENRDGNGSGSRRVRAVLAVPLIAPDEVDFVCGAIIVAQHHSRAFSQHQVSVLQMIAAQVALVVQNARRIAQLEYKAMLEERGRLAREIHDGLAQTLGFSKLKTAQMRNYLERGDLASLGKTIETLYEVLSEAYQDVRQAIDNLRIAPAPNGLIAWLQQTADEFKEYCDLNVNLHHGEPLPDPPPEVQAQMIRIVQEALSNVRKHARARNVEISCHLVNNDLLLEISDDGVGFCVEDVPSPSQHGLRGMRERAELIAADLQVTSHPNQGTVVSLRLPAQALRLAREKG